MIVYEKSKMWKVNDGRQTTDNTPSTQVHYVLKVTVPWLQYTQVIMYWPKPSEMTSTGLVTDYDIQYVKLNMRRIGRN